MKIRSFKESDRQAVILLWDQCNLTTPQNNPSLDIDRKLKVDPDLFLVGIFNHQVIATVMGGYEGHRGWVNYLAVSPEHQRKGYGQAVMLAVEKLLVSKGCPKINLQVRASNKKIMAFYCSIGYGDDSVIGLGKRFEDDSNVKVL